MDRQSRFSQMHKIDNNGNVGIRDFEKTQKSGNKMLHTLGKEPLERFAG